MNATTAELTLNVKKILADGMSEVVSITELADNLPDDFAADHELTNRYTCGIYGQEDNSGIYLMPKDGTPETMDALTDCLEDNRFVKEYEIVDLFCDSNNNVPSEIRAEFHRLMAAEFDQLGGTYEPHYLACDKADVARILSDAVATWIGSQV